MRGKDGRELPPAINHGITPAHAGKSCHVYRCSASCWDHPRVCGEKMPPSAPASSLCGSPPRMRGKAALYEGTGPPTRITPAHAGKSIWFPSCPVCRWDHPRACGEKPALQAGPGIPLGSPPRMRGKVKNRLPRAIRVRITPAHAGKS